MEAYTYYVKKGDNNRVAELPKLDSADGLIAVTITSIEKDYFLENWDSTTGTQWGATKSSRIALTFTGHVTADYL
ncbi:hypothetical protein [Levilactobacillus brevis]|uniref:hypothetical protein n=1 Tax=Levilactobacillus brevis TaxID=1580 RepID=UPI0008481794|nr:hypothetical protein [Levilactobacillus brevis]ODP95408.1 hypothetical protein BGC39_14050 [Levilactobacillus brevis]